MNRMRTLQNYIEEKLIVNKDFTNAEQYKDDSGNITVENYESFQYWLDENNIAYEILEQTDKRNQFGSEAECIISLSINDKVNNDVSLIYTFITDVQFFWQYFIGDKCVYDRDSSTSINDPDTFIEYVEKRRRPISYIKDMIKTADNKRKKYARKNDYYGRQQMERRIERFNNLITRMTA